MTDHATSQEAPLTSLSSSLSSFPGGVVVWSSLGDERKEQVVLQKLTQLASFSAAAAVTPAAPPALGHGHGHGGGLAYPDTGIFPGGNHVEDVEKTIADYETVTTLAAIISHSLRPAEPGTQAPNTSQPAGRSQLDRGKKQKQQRREWKTQAPGETVGYEKDLAPTYALRSTLPHALFLHHVFSSTSLVQNLLFKQGPESNEMMLVFLGGGSGAELLSLVHLVIQERLKLAAQNGDDENQESGGEPPKKKQRVVSGMLTLHILVADYAESWRETIARYAESIRSVWAQELESASLALEVTFVQVDLLTEEGCQKITEACSKAALITLLYTITELYERDLAATTSFFERVLMNLRPSALFLIADPVSNEICHDKTTYLDTLTSVPWIHPIDRKTRKISYGGVFLETVLG